MPEADPAIGVIAEQDLEPDQVAPQGLGEFAANNDLQVPELTDSALEMPASHADFDPKDITVGGLIKVCSHFAEIAKRNPELAEAKAAEVVQSVRERDTMREKGMSDEAIKKQQWSSMLKEHQEKTETEEKPRTNPDSVDTEPVEPSVAVSEPVPEQPAVEPSGTTSNDIAETIDAQLATKREDVERAHSVVSIWVDKKDSSLDELLREAEPSETIKPVPSVPARRLVAKQGSGSTLAGEGGQEARRLPVLQPAERLEQTSHNDVTELKQDHESESAEQHDPAIIGTPEPDELSSTADPALETEKPELIEADLSGEDIAERPFVESGAILGPELPAITEPTFEQAEPSIEPVSTESITWDDILEEEPLDFYSDFAQALNTLIIATEGAPENDTAEEAAEDSDLQAAEIQKEPVPVIVSAVAERLGQLEPAERITVAPILQEVVGALREVQSLRTEDAEAERIEAAEKNLEELVVTLFESINIDYQEEDVAAFMATLLRPDFRPVQPIEAEETTEVDLEHDGTHEARIHLSQVADDLADIEHELLQLIGEFVLFCTSGSLTGRYSLAA